MSFVAASATKATTMAMRAQVVRRMPAAGVRVREVAVVMGSFGVGAGSAGSDSWNGS